MAKARMAIQHFIACLTIEPMQIGFEFAYRLIGVSYAFDVPANREWPIRFDDLMLYVRFFNGTGSASFDIDFVWLDGPDGEQEVCSFTDYQVQFGRRPAAASRAFRVAAARFPGPGRYEFRMRRHARSPILAREQILIRRR